jgi:hypothetical protein
MVIPGLRNRLPVEVVRFTPRAGDPSSTADAGARQLNSSV